MGCFNATCVISGLAIQAGDPVRFFALTASRFGRVNDYRCYVHGYWQTRGAAIRAEYNDYGSIENIEKSFTTDLFFESFNKDAVEMGTGDNECHDSRVVRGMSQREWLDALWEGRVHVLDSFFDKYDYDDKRKPEDVPSGVPTIQRIEALLKEKFSKCPVDELNVGFVRVRNDAYKHDVEQLEAIAKLAQKSGYAAMVTQGTGVSYARGAEVIIAPKPMGERLGTGGVREVDPDPIRRKKPRPVVQAMVREDVWQALLQEKIDRYHGAYDFKMVRTSALHVLGVELEHYRALHKARTAERKQKELRHYLNRNDDEKQIFAGLLHSGEGVTGYHYRQAMELALSWGLEYNKEEKDFEAFIVDLAEMAYVEWVYSLVHGQWHPSTNNSQNGEWKAHQSFLRKILNICDKKVEEEKKYDDE